MNISRYNSIEAKNKREIVLLKSHPCAWGNCSFCDYISDNDTNENLMINLNNQILQKVDGRHGVLEVINSGSCFELPKQTLQDIKSVVVKKNIKKLIFESHWSYRNRLYEMREFFNIPILFKCGIESFNDEFRNKTLKKGVIFKNIDEIKSYFDSVCIMVGIQGQTPEMIDYDIKCLLENFKYACINIYIENSTPIKKDPYIIEYFKNNYSHLQKLDNIEILWENTDFGVGGKI